MIFFIRQRLLRFSTAMIACTCVLVNLCTNTEIVMASANIHKQNLDYTESKAVINNPDQGFYEPLYVTMTPKGVVYDTDTSIDEFQLYHLRIDISAFSKKVNGKEDIPFTDVALKQLDALLSTLNKKEKNAIIRFAYAPEFGDAKDMEPSKDMILTHVRQASKIFDKYQDTITAIEVGMIGPWGEMHSSAIASDKSLNNALINAYLTETKNFPILVRTPDRIYKYLNIKISQIGSYKIKANSKAYRLGIFNDGYLGSETDTGTYTNRKKEVKWLAKQTAHLPYGGEVINPKSRLHDVDKCLPEMKELHLSYLNLRWNDKVISKWKKSKYTKLCGKDKLYYGESAFTYIQNHLGYRFVLESSELEYPKDFSTMKIHLKIKNVGFGNLNRNKSATIILSDAKGRVTQIPVGKWNGKRSYNINLNLKKYNLKKGKYQMYLKVDNGSGKYVVRFANKKLWNKKLKATKIGEFLLT